MAPRALDCHALSSQGVRDMCSVEAWFKWTAMTWFADESVEGVLIGPGKNVAPTFSTAQVSTIQLQVVDSFLWTLLPGDQCVDHLHSGQLGLSFAWGTLTWLLIGFFELGN